MLTTALLLMSVWLIATMIEWRSVTTKLMRFVLSSTLVRSFGWLFGFASLLSFGLGFPRSKASVTETKYLCL